jgi:hypothetical protein
MDDSLIWLDGGRFGHVGPRRDGGAALMPPTLKEAPMAALGLVICYVAFPFVIFAGNAEIAFVLYVIDQVRK